MSARCVPVRLVVCAVLAVAFPGLAQAQHQSHIAMDYVGLEARLAQPVHAEGRAGV